MQGPQIPSPRSPQDMPGTCQVSSSIHPVGWISNVYILDVRNGQERALARDENGAGRILPCSSVCTTAQIALSAVMW